MAKTEQIQAWKDLIKNYKDIYADLYPGCKPTDTCIKAFCQINCIPWPLSDVEVEKEFDFLG